MKNNFVHPVCVLCFALGDASTVDTSTSTQCLRVVLMQQVSTASPEMLSLLLKLNLLLGK